MKHTDSYWIHIFPGINWFKIGQGLVQTSFICFAEVYHRCLACTPFTDKSKCAKCNNYRTHETLPTGHCYITYSPKIVQLSKFKIHWILPILVGDILTASKTTQSISYLTRTSTTSPMFYSLSTNNTLPTLHPSQYSKLPLLFKLHSVFPSTSKFYTNHIHTLLLTRFHIHINGMCILYQS
jgi:hypothetical protein